MKKMNWPVIVRGGGDLATGTIHRLFSAGIPVLVLEIPDPAAIRRQVSFCEAVYEGSMEVEGVTAVRIERAEDWQKTIADGKVPVLVDPDATAIHTLRPDIVVDAILAKKNLGTERAMTPLTIALGPGFTAGKDVDLVVETKRGHNLGRIYRQGTAAPNSGIPGIIGGYGKERVIHAPAAGVMHNCTAIADTVEVGQVIAVIRQADGGEIPVHATISGLLRGLIREGYPVTEGFKIADIDPRLTEYNNCFTISDKARCIAGSVLEAVCAFLMED